MLKLLYFLAVALILSAHMGQAGVLFKFGFDFHVRSGSAEQQINKTFTLGDNSEETTGPITETTTTPNDWNDVGAQQQNLLAPTKRIIQSTRSAIYNMHQELSGVEGSSAELKAKAKAMSDYIYSVDAWNLKGPNASGKFDVLRRFVQLVDQLSRPDSDAGESVNALMMKLLLEKHHVQELQTEVAQQVLAAEEWQKYVREKLIEVNL